MAAIHVRFLEVVASHESNGRDAALRRPQPGRSSGLAFRSEASNSSLALLRMAAPLRGADAARQPYPVHGLDSHPDYGIGGSHDSAAPRQSAGRSG
ncbi:MAG TPA: hypothetical protein DCE44_04605 [Verrucomicrobiales bacterium]|nr:hypothetical protein [Verrucomicrobiales bacterium]